MRTMAFLILLMLFSSSVSAEIETIRFVAIATKQECVNFLQNHPNCKLIARIDDLVEIECEVEKETNKLPIHLFDEEIICENSRDFFRLEYGEYIVDGCDSSVILSEKIRYVIKKNEEK